MRIQVTTHAIEQFRVRFKDETNKRRDIEDCLKRVAYYGVTLRTTADAVHLHKGSVVVVGMFVTTVEFMILTCYKKERKKYEIIQKES